MMLNVNGITYLQCDMCEDWRRSGELCKCLLDERRNALSKLLDIGRKQNEHMVFCLPNMFTFQEKQGK